ncbi:hypothetical protein H5410_044174 [Solanum commersonii]|uniref:F-box domain-containing protein n=1 Tax=Solanum commersonii TaxID=4109 RepID=A0A9J5X947_SOLCO|nr:hypothetical protein H5410_044174 [Solanum commersonii]
MPACKTWKEIFCRTSFIEQNFNESKSELLIQSGYVRHMKTKLIEIGKDLECESHDFYFGKLRVINPATKFCITIPGCPSRCQHGTCSAALVFDSSTEQYKVVHIVNYCFGFEIFNLSNDEENWKWERIDSYLWEGVNNQPFDVKFCWKKLVSINGRILHWYVNSSEYFVSMDVKEGKFSRTYLPQRDEVVNKTNNYALIQLDGFLSYITCDSEATMDVWILEDSHGQVWSKKHTIVAELTHYVCPSKSARPNERSMPEIGKLVAVGGARNGEVLILKHQKNSKQYLYDTKSKVMKMFNIYNMRNSESFWYMMSPNESKCYRSLLPDVLSNLPDHVIDVILMCLPCKDSARTSILSKKWRYNWCRRTELTLDKSHWITKNDLLYPTVKFKKIICQFLTLHEGPITKFTLDIVNLENSPEIDNFIYFLSRNGIQHLVLHLSFDNPYKLPSSVFTCSQLRHLSLHNCSIHHSSAFKGFNRLISLELCEVIISSELLESLIYHCPLLEQLVLVILENLDTIEINVPTLRTLDFTGYISSICLKNAPCLVKLSLEGRYMEVEDLDFAKVFESCSALEHLLFDFSNFEFYAEEGYEVPTRLPFDLNSVKRFNLPYIMLIESYKLSYAFCLIKSFPYLEYLEIQLYSEDEEDDRILECLELQRFSDVTFNHLREVKLKCFGGTMSEMQLIKLLLAKSPVLVRMLIDQWFLEHGSLDTRLKILNEVSHFLRASPKAEVVYLDLFET